MMTGWWWRWWWPGGDICQLFITTLTLADSGVRSVSQPARRLICAMMMSGLGYDRNTWSWSCLIYICEKLQAGRSWLELVQYHPGWCWYRVVRKLLCKALVQSAGTEQWGNYCARRLGSRLDGITTECVQSTSPISFRYMDFWYKEYPQTFIKNGNLCSLALCHIIVGPIWTISSKLNPPAKYWRALPVYIQIHSLYLGRSRKCSGNCAFCMNFFPK